MDPDGCVITRGNVSYERTIIHSGASTNGNKGSGAPVGIEKGRNAGLSRTEVLGNCEEVTRTRRPDADVAAVLNDQSGRVRGVRPNLVRCTALKVSVGG